MDVFSRKKQLRERLLRQRRSLPEPKRRRLSAAICENLLSLSELAAAKTVLSYLPAGGEADVGALNELLQKNGAAVAFPVCGSDGSMEAYLPRRRMRLASASTGSGDGSRRARRIPPRGTRRGDRALRRFQPGLPPPRTRQGLLRPLPSAVQKCVYRGGRIRLPEDGGSSGG